MRSTVPSGCSLVRGIITPRHLSNWRSTEGGVVTERRRPGAVAESRSPSEEHKGGHTAQHLSYVYYSGESQRIKDNGSQRVGGDRPGETDLIMGERINNTCKVVIL